MPIATGCSSSSGSGEDPWGQTERREHECRRASRSVGGTLQGTECPCLHHYREDCTKSGRAAAYPTTQDLRISRRQIRQHIVSTLLNAFTRDSPTQGTFVNFQIHKTTSFLCCHCLGMFPPVNTDLTVLLAQFDSDVLPVEHLTGQAGCPCPIERI